MMMCIIEVGAGLLACSLATLRPLLVLWLEMTASSKYSKAQYTSSCSAGNGTARSRPSGKLSNYVLPELPSHAIDIEKGKDTELVDFQTRGGTFFDTRRRHSEDSVISLV